MTRKTHVMHGSLPEDSVSRFLVENDEITLGLGDAGILVRASGRSPVTIESLTDLPAAVETLAAQPANSRPDRRDFAPRGTVLKAAPDVDLYCLWSGNVDNVVAAGTRQEMLAEGVPASRLARADLWGTSARWPDMPEPYPIPYRADGWDTECLVVHEQDHAPTRGGGLLRRGRMVEFLRAKLAGDEAAAGALLEPFEDDE